MGKKEYPYQNISLEDIKGERWKDIPGFEDEYQLSNFGRLKPQDRMVDYGNYECFRQGRIKKLHQSLGPKSDLMMQLHKHGKRYHFSVARYVYYLFVTPFDTSDHSAIISRQDGDVLNCYYKNLVLRSISDVAKEGFATNRRKSQFQLQAKPVTQYGPDGRQMATFKDAKQAGAATGLLPNYINDAARTCERMSGGYFWRYGSPEPKIDVLSIKGTPVLPTSSKKDFSGHHYQNRSVKNIRNEKWKAIEGFEGLYEISDYGRVKALHRLKQYTSSKGNRSQFWTREFIIKQILTKSRNHYINKPLHRLVVGLNKEGKSTRCTVSRLVYLAFGKNTPEMDSIAVIHKDSDNLNNHISNLQLASQSEVHRISFAKNRRRSHFTDLTLKQRRKYALRTAEANKKPVIQYSLQNKRIANFDSLKAAAKATGTSSSGISNALNGRINTAGGYIWRWGNR